MSKKKRSKNTINCNLVLEKIKPLTSGQKQFFESYKNIPHHILHGTAGTGKTLCALYLAMKDLFNDDKLLEKVVIVRSAVPTRDIGFLPGTVEEKLEAYEAPYEDLLCHLFNRSDAYDICKLRGNVEVLSTSFIRGLTIDNAIVIVDEAQNMTFHELDSIITRIGDNTRVIICGDVKQTDFTKRREKSGLSQLIDVVQHMPFDVIDITTFTPDDIVRSGFVRDYILARDNVLTE